MLDFAAVHGKRPLQASQQFHAVALQQCTALAPVYLGLQLQSSLLD